MGVLPIKGSHILIISIVSGRATDTFIIRLILWQQGDGRIFIPTLQVRKLRLRINQFIQVSQKVRAKPEWKPQLTLSQVKHFHSASLKKTKRVQQNEIPVRQRSERKHSALCRKLLPPGDGEEGSDKKVKDT